MDNYFNSYRDMISLRGLADHTLKSYCTYIRAYLDYLQNSLHKLPEDVSWQELRDFIRWLQNERGISDRTVNTAISQIRFLPYMFCINLGMTHSFLCVNLIPICLLFLHMRKR